MFLRRSSYTHRDRERESQLDDDTDMSIVTMTLTQTTTAVTASNYLPVVILREMMRTFLLLSLMPPHWVNCINHILLNKNRLPCSESDIHSIKTHKSNTVLHEINIDMRGHN